MAKLQHGLIFLALFLFSIVLSISAQEVEDEREFDYIEGSEKGPARWGLIKKEWATCKSGKYQSPIDLVNPRVEIVPKCQQILKFYRPAKAYLKNRGHDIMIKWKGEEAGKIQISGTDYILSQAHWHSPSEHTINGTRYPMELHMVHMSADKKIAVIGLFYTIGQPDPFLSKLMDELNIVPESSEEIDVGPINPVDIKMKGDVYYRYVGSLTTPPCSEGVLWTVNVEIATVSWEQVALLRESVHDDSESNARPLQPRNGRKVKLYSSHTSREKQPN